MILHLRPSETDEAGSTGFRPKPDGNVDPAGEAGWFLQRERERLGKSLADAALETQIPVRDLLAIEAGRLEELPRGSYVLGYVRLYAQFLKLDPEPLVAHYRKLVQPLEGASTKAEVLRMYRQALPTPRLASTGLAAASVLLVGIVVGTVWFAAPGLLPPPYADVATNGIGETVATAPETAGDAIITGSIDTGAGTPLQDPANTEPPEAALPSVTITDESLSTVLDTLETDRPSANSLSEADREPVAGPPAAAEGLTEFIRQHVDAGTATEVDRVAATSGGEAVVYGIENGNARVVLRATKEVWIRVEDGEGNVMLNQTLRPGDSYRVPDKDGIWL